MPRSSRGAARRYADLSRKRRTQRPTRVFDTPEQEGEDTPVPVTELAPEPTPSVSEDGTPIVRHHLGETRLNIAPRLRGAVVSRPSTFESTDYRYVLTDLRRVFTVAGILLAALIALSFVIS